MTNQNPLISVIVPVYRVEQYLHRCIDSILSQTYTNLEIILVDDGSPDRSGEICDEYAAKDSRIRVIHQANAGVSAARNAALDVCTGDYLTFLDSDDYYDHSLFIDCVVQLRKHNPDMVDWGFRFVDQDEVQTRIHTHTLPKGVCIHREEIEERILPQLVHTKQIDSDFLGAWIWNKLFRVQHIRSLHLRFAQDIRLWEDGIFTIEYMQLVDRLVCLEGIYYNYRDTANSLSTRNDDNLYLYAMRIYEKYRSIYAEQYDFENDVAKSYRFELAHGVIMRKLSFLSRKIITKQQARTSLIQMLRHPLFTEYIKGKTHRNPIILSIQIQLKVGCPIVAVEMYLLYQSLLDWKNRQ